MAGDWMKMRTNLWDDPRVGGVMDQTDASEATVIGGLYWLWAMADKHTADGWLPTMSLRQIDRKTGIAGFGQALATIGWIEVREGGLMMARFDEHNGQSAKRRVQTAHRVAKHKSGNAGDPRAASKGNADAAPPGDAGNADCGTDREMGNGGDGAVNESGNAPSVTENIEQRYLEKRREEKSFTPDSFTQSSGISEGASDAGRACVLMRQAGCHTTNPSHPDLLAAIAEGVTPEALGDTVREGLNRPTPVSNVFPWAITTARNRLAQGGQPITTSGGPNANPQPGSADYVAQLHEQYERNRGRNGNAEGAGGGSGEVVDAEFIIVP